MEKILLNYFQEDTIVKELIEKDDKKNISQYFKAIGKLLGLYKMVKSDAIKSGVKKDTIKKADQYVAKSIKKLKTAKSSVNECTSVGIDEVVILEGVFVSVLKEVALGIIRAVLIILAVMAAPFISVSIPAIGPIIGTAIIGSSFILHIVNNIYTFVRIILVIIHHAQQGTIDKETANQQAKKATKKLLASIEKETNDPGLKRKIGEVKQKL